MPDLMDLPNGEAPQPKPQGETPATWEAFLDGQPDEIKGLYGQYVSGLQNAVKATREERDALAKQVKDLATKSEKGSEAEKSLTEFASRLEAAERRAVFFEDAIRPEIGCSNPRLALALATADNLFDRKGAPDWNAIKAAAPEIFRKPTANGNAGAGTVNQPQKADMNSMLRQAVGR
jgi:hypothetical protein